MLNLSLNSEVPQSLFPSLALSLSRCANLLEPLQLLLDILRGRCKVIFSMNSLNTEKMLDSLAH